MTAPLLAGLVVLVLAAAWQPTPPPRLPARSTEPTTTSTTPRRSPPTRRMRPRRARRSDPAAIATWCDDLARATRTGSSLTAALRDTKPPASLTASIDRLTRALDRGTPLATALAGVDTDDPHAATAISVLTACAETGGPPGRPIDRVAAALRVRANDRADRHVYSAQARASARVLTILPFGALSALVATSPSVRQATTTPIGVACIGTGLVLNLGGWWWMHRLVESAAT